MKDKGKIRRFGRGNIAERIKLIYRSASESFLPSLFFIVLFILGGSAIFAATLNCSIINANSCNSPNLTLFRLLNDTSGYFNAHVQNASLSGYSPAYNYSVCCSSDSVLSSSCSEAVVLKMFNFTNAHAQFANYTGPYSVYNYSSCLSAEPGIATCTYSQSSCAAGYTCLASLASSETWANNETNAHVGPCSEYNTKICCKINSPPVISEVILNSTYATNYTYENLTVYFSENDSDGDAYTNITDWRRSGISVALLNLAFDTNTSSNSSGAIKDYSSYGNSGTLGGGASANAPVWTSDGKIGGAYKFDGDNDIITVPGTWHQIATKTLSFWANPNCMLGLHQMPLSTGGNYYVSFQDVCNANRLYISITNSSGSQKTVSWSGLVAPQEWHYYVVTVDVNGSYVNRSIYIDGVLRGSSTYYEGHGTNYGSVFYIGALSTNYDFNGTLDEIQIFNYSLSANQINAMYEAGVGNHSVQMMHSDETNKGEIWSVAVTGNDGFNDGPMVLSNNLTIRGSIPNVTLVSPVNGNSTRLRTPTFIWNATDLDGDVMTYTINITEVKFAGQFLCDDDIYNYADIMNYTPASDLKCFYDNDYYYLWSVRVNDSDGYSDWTETWKLNMTAVVDMSMPTNFISFGQLSLSQEDNTTDNLPPPFVIQNDGNALININITSTDIWDSTDNPNQFYQFKINSTEESGAFNWVNSTTSWTFMPAVVTNISAIGGLRYEDAFDSALIDIFLKVPPSEPPGNKTATVTFMSILAE